MLHSDNQNGTFTNPVIFADYPDPDIIRVGEDFYLASSSFTDAPGIPICHSRDLVNWRIAGHVYDRLPAQNPAYSMDGGKDAYRGGSWAPSIRHHAGMFHVAFNTPAEGFFLGIAGCAAGPYDLLHFGGLELYDPGLFFEGGRSFVVHGTNDIYLSELMIEDRRVAGPPLYLFSSAYASPFEGSHVHKRNGYYYVFNTSRGYHGLQAVCRSRQLQGPYESRLVTADDMNYAGAGVHQGGIIELENGETWFCAFQDRDYVGRVPMLFPVRWEDDWPLVGDPANFGKLQVTCAKSAYLPPAEPIAVPEGGDDFASSSLGLQWHWNHNPDDTRWSLTARPGWLRIVSGFAADFLHARNTLTQKIVGGGCFATVKLDAGALLPGDLAGICVFGFPYAYLAAEATPGGLRLIMVNDGNRIAETPVVSAPVVYLRSEADANGIARFSFSEDDVTYAPLGDDLTMQFTVRTFLGNKFGMFCFNPVAGVPTGHADFDFFRYETVRSAHHRFYAREEIPATAYDAERGTRPYRYADKKPRQFLAELHHGDWVRFDHIDFGKGVNRFETLASAAGDGGSIELRLDDHEGELIGTCVLRGGGERNQWHCPWDRFSCDVKHISGVRAICLRFTGSVGPLMRVDHFIFRV